MNAHLLVAIIVDLGEGAFGVQADGAPSPSSAGSGVKRGSSKVTSGVSQSRGFVSQSCDAFLAPSSFGS